MKSEAHSSSRLLSLDILRGADLWLLLFAGPILSTIVETSTSPEWDAVRAQIYHPEWHGFVLWDIIMPLFMFMSGATIPFSMARYKDGRSKPDKTFWIKLMKRFCLLFILGWIVQGNLLSLDPKVFHPFANTLQAIAVGYVITAIVYAYGGIKWQIIVSSVCFIAYFMVFSIAGQLDPDPVNNIAMDIDKAILGSHRDGVIFAADGSWSYDSEYRYTWILSSLNFIVTVMLGSFATQILRRGGKKPESAAKLAIFGLILLVCGLLMSLVFPILKKIWSSSMTLYSGGICCLLLAVFFYVIDVRGHSKAVSWLKYYGMNSIAAYCIGEVIVFSSVSNSILHGFAHWLGPWYGVLIATANATILFFILKLMYKRGVFLKV